MEDWENLRNKTLSLARFDLQWWIDAIEPILNEFVRASSGTVNREFWKAIYKKTDLGSGGPFITGWILTLFPYLDSSIFRRNPYLTSWNTNKSDIFFSGATTTSFPSGTVTTPFIWRFPLDGIEYEMDFYAGFLGVGQDQTSLAIRPVIGWAVADRDGVTVPHPIRKRFDVGFVETLVRMEEGTTRVLNLTIFQPDLSEVDSETSLNLSIVVHQEQGVVSVVVEPTGGVALSRINPSIPVEVMVPNDDICTGMRIYNISCPYNGPDTNIVRSSNVSIQVTDDECATPVPTTVTASTSVPVFVDSSADTFKGKVIYITSFEMWIQGCS